MHLNFRPSAAHLPLGFVLKFWRLEAALGHQHQRSEKQCERRHWTGKCPSSNHPESAKSVCLQLFVQSPLFMLTHLIGCRSNMGGCSSASSMAVMPTAQISHRWLQPPFFSTAATSGAILLREEELVGLIRKQVCPGVNHSLTFNDKSVKHQYLKMAADCERSVALLET